MQTVFDEIVRKISELTPEEKSELLRRLIESDQEIEEDEKKSKADEKSK